MGEKTDSERINALIKERMLKRLPVQARISTPVEGLTLTRRDEVSPPDEDKKTLCVTGPQKGGPCEIMP